ncbi:hypothetical protein P5673_033686 [Acropora cervicornis]|uniref:Uncharacterized protein n=1 Tax=Acropora cervicornis TaxID=6130 RepID=A0AAD9PPU6_ACRCE|nr:hypothetical protein P5673_033686 [Acropora cervicornis]
MATLRNSMMESENNETKKKSIVVWTESKDLSLLRTIAAEGIFVNTKAGSRERVRDRYHILAKKWKAKVAAEEKESGGGEKDMTEVEVLLEELVDLESESEKVAEQQNEAKKAAAAKEKKQATEMRQRALERFGETRKRQPETEKEEGKKETKRRRSGGGALEWLKEKGESLRELKEKELQDKKEEREIQKMQREQFVGQLQATQVANNDQMKMLQQQQHQQQQQQQQFTMLQHQMMVMMQQHAQLMSNLLKKDD